MKTCFHQNSMCHSTISYLNRFKNTILIFLNVHLMFVNFVYV